MRHVTQNAGITAIGASISGYKGPWSNQNVGMVDDRADKSGRGTRSTDPTELLRSGGLGAFLRPSQTEDAGITREQLRTLVRRGVV